MRSMDRSRAINMRLRRAPVGNVVGEPSAARDSVAFRTFISELRMLTPINLRNAKCEKLPWGYW